MTRKIIFIFPGQASQYVGMGKDFYEKSPAARDVMDTVAALDGLGHIPDLCFNGPAETLTRTDNVQPAIITISLMALAALRESTQTQPVACAGHSLGEYAAHAAAGNLSFETAIRLVQWRGRWMNEASQPPNPAGAMIAVMGLNIKALNGIVGEVGTDKVAVANINSPGQLILSGEKSAIAKADELAKKAGAKRTVLLNVSGAWHSPLMIPAERKMKELLEKEITPEKIALSNSISVVANATAEVVDGIDTLKETLTRQVTSPVKWDSCVERLLQVAGHSGLPSKTDSADPALHKQFPLFVEVGPGKVLKGLLRSIDRKLAVVNVEDMDGLKTLKESIADS